MNICEYLGTRTMINTKRTSNFACTSILVFLCYTCIKFLEAKQMKKIEAIKISELCKNDEVKFTDCPEFLTPQDAILVASHTTLTVSELNNHEIVANVTWDIFQSTEETNTSYILELFLNTSGKLTDKKCFAISKLHAGDFTQQNKKIQLNCIKMISEPSAILTSRIFSLKDESCDCKVSQTAGSDYQCNNQCQPLLENGNHRTDLNLRNERCLYWKKKKTQTTPTLTPKAMQFTSGVIRITVTSANNNPFSDIELLVFPDDPYVRQPIADKFTTPNKYGFLHVVFSSQICNYTKFYVKMLTLCPDELIYGDTLPALLTKVFEVKDPVLPTPPVPTPVHGGYTSNGGKDIMYGVLAGSFCLIGCVIGVFIYKRRGDAETLSVHLQTVSHQNQHQNNRSMPLLESSKYDVCSDGENSPLKTS